MSLDSAFNYDEDVLRLLSFMKNDISLTVRPALTDSRALLYHALGDILKPPESTKVVKEKIDTGLVPFSLESLVVSLTAKIGPLRKAT